MKFFTVQISDSIKKGITNVSVCAGVRCSTKSQSIPFCLLRPIAQQAKCRRICVLVALFSFLAGPVPAQMWPYEAAREIDRREWENIDRQGSSLDQDERFRLKAEAPGIFQDKFLAETPVAAISSVKPVAHAGMNICKRTAAVLSAILSKISGTNDCSEVTSTQLAAITGFLQLDSKNISSLKAGDFDGLISLTSLELRRNSLSALPDGIFDELTSLTGLDLRHNNLATLPDGIFDELTSLYGLELSDNALSVLPDGIFDSLTSLEKKYLGGLALRALRE
ncbi:MAG: leucine-rich repeat domain-containing protein, partial [Rhodothermaceae bacterium]|nr:leucine-rich repeat domain-containing protein [Rhodothermaceae bacterium]